MPTIVATQLRKSLWVGTTVQMFLPHTEEELRWWCKHAGIRTLVDAQQWVLRGPWITVSVQEIKLVMKPFYKSIAEQPNTYPCKEYYEKALHSLASKITTEETLHNPNILIFERLGCEGGVSAFRLIWKRRSRGVI